MALALGAAGSLAGCAGRELNGVAERIVGVQKEVQRHTYERIEAGRDVVIQEARSAIEDIKGQIVTEIWGWFKKGFWMLGGMGILSLRKRHVTAPVTAAKAIGSKLKSVAASVRIPN